LRLERGGGSLIESCSRGYYTRDQVSFGDRAMEVWLLTGSSGLDAIWDACVAKHRRAGDMGRGREEIRFRAHLDTVRAMIAGYAELTWQSSITESLQAIW
jgi:hypothetical protein